MVNRDPRDVFILNKYIWTRDGDPVPFPTDVNFGGYYKRLRSVEKKYNHTHIHVVQFEDLIYNYDETVERIMDILGVDKTKHIEKNRILIRIKY